MNELRNAAHRAALRQMWHFRRLAKLVEDLRHRRHPHAPHLPSADYVVLITALRDLTEELGLARVSHDAGTQALYVAIRSDGGSHVLAEMLALQSPPMSNTDREFLEGHCNGSQFADTPAVGDYYAAEARAAGVDIKGKIYMAGLALYAGDPRAWVADRGEVESVVRERNMTVTGSVNVKTEDLGPPPEDVTIADDLVADRVADLVEQNPELARADQGELFHNTREHMKPHWGD